MHVIFRESHGLEETETPTDLAQSPADLVVLSFSDSDLTAFSAGWYGAKNQGRALPSLRLANLGALQHPLSVDTYIEQTLSGARAILIRLIGGASYWSYGLAQVRALAEKNGIALAVLPADGRDDPQLDALSTVPASTRMQLNALCNAGGARAAQAALAQLAFAAGHYVGPVLGDKTLPDFGCWDPSSGPKSCQGACAFARELLQESGSEKETPFLPPLVAIVFYRSYLAAADTAPIKALFDALRAKGLRARAFFVPSLKAPEAAAWLSEKLESLAPAAIINATAFSGKTGDGASPLDASGAPVFQIALATSTQQAWAEAERGLSPTDLAMHVVLPEVDGRLFAGVASFKEPQARDPELQFAPYVHTPAPSRIEAITTRVTAQIALATKAPSRRKTALVLSTYPGKDWQMGHAVGLDAFASTNAILSDMALAGYLTGQISPQALAHATIEWSLSDYAKALASLPKSLREDLTAAWGQPEADQLVKNGAFSFKALVCENTLVALQPERATLLDRVETYHDLARTPCHSYVAFYLWLRQHHSIDALIHIGAHGTLEWLPGKSVALSDACWPEALIGATPVIYPFIVNDPGEAAQAKRRIAAVTLGHIPPPLKDSAAPARFASLETLLDEFSNADGLDPKRRDRLQSDIRTEAAALGVEADLGLDEVSCSAEAITRIDRFVCDIKESQFGDGLHIWGRAPAHQDKFKTQPSAIGERQALLDALAGRRIEAGPSGSPYRGRSDVLPTGRNLFTTDPRAVPSRAAYAQGVTLAEELVRRHLQDEGDYPKGLIVDLWGSATMRTAGEEFAMALHLLGAKPVWDDGSERVSGIEILPLAELDRPRIDVTLRVSGLFRDVFPTLATLFAQAVETLSARDEALDFNPFAGSEPSPRVYGPAPASYGLGMGDLPENYSSEGRKAAGEAWLTASGWATDGRQSLSDPEGIRKRVAQADTFVHLQDLPETDLLLAADYATHEAGFAAAKAVTGGTATLYHLDNTDPEKPRARLLKEEIARVVRARAANPDWIAGMQRHGFRGGAEIAATLDHMAAFANLANAVGPHLFDAFYDVTLGDEDVSAFLAAHNPQALEAMRARFAQLLEAGLWDTRRNAIRADLGEPA
ncbi:MAG: cobaltochelatase subunit CobN [Paracoccaceae bacterium]